MRSCRYDKILIAVDNIDDCSEDVKDIAFAFAETISDAASQVQGVNLPQVSILVPLRQYTHIATDTEGYSKIDMPVHDVGDIIQTKINHVEHLINENIGKNFKGKVSTDKIIKREITLDTGKIKIIHERNVSGKMLQV